MQNLEETAKLDSKNPEEMQLCDPLGCMHLLEECLNRNLIQQDPEDPNRILVYRNTGTPSEDFPEGWYSENLFDIAAELASDPEGQEYLENLLFNPDSGN